MRSARIGLAALAMGMIACVDATDPTAAPAPKEGSALSIIGTSSITVPTLDGRLVRATTREWAVDGVVTRGLAEASRPNLLRITDPNGPKMPVLFIADDNRVAQGETQRISRGKDDFVFGNGGGGPAKTMVHVVNGEVDQAYSYEWRRVRGGWEAAAFTVTLFKGGKATAQIRSVNRKYAPAPTGPSMILASDDPCWYDIECDPWGMTGGGGGGLYGGGSGGGYGGGYGGYDCNCTAQLQDYLAAAAALATATQIAIDTGTILEPWVALGLAAAAAYVGILLMRYNSCYRACQRREADAGWGGASLFAAPLLSRDDRLLLRPA